MVAIATVSARADVVLSGPDSNDGSYSTAELSTLGATDGSVGDSGTGLTGVTLWTFLGGANAASPTSPTYGAISTSTPGGDNAKNAIFRYYLLATNAAGAQSVVSLGEIDPNFGGTAANPSSPALLAYKLTGGSLLASPTLVVPGAPGLDLSNVTSLQLLSVPALPNPGEGIVSSAVQLSGNVTNPGAYTAAQLESSFTPVREGVSGDTYTGVPLYTFLDPSDSNITNQIVVAEATDGYEVVYSLAELDPALGGNPADLLPYADTEGNFPGDGVARTILPTDGAHGRWVSNLDAIEVEAVPEPASLLLLAAGAIPAVVLRRGRSVSRDAGL